jgi:U3 small nucleolar RNA-associated protein 3
VQIRSGDDDILPRKPLHERRAAFDAVAARRAAAADDGDEYDYGSGAPKKRQRQHEEDELYTAAKVQRMSSKEAKKAAHQVPQLAPPLPVAEAAGQRKISYEIEKNRGLTPHRWVAGSLRVWGGWAEGVV